MIIAHMNKYFLVNADHDRYVVFTSEYVDTTYHLTTVKHPQHIFGECKFSGHGTAEEITVDIYNKVDGKIYNTNMTRLKRSIHVHGLGFIYEYRIYNINPCLPLPTEFYNVFVGKDIHCEFHLSIKKTTPQKKIPVHVLKGFVNGLVFTKQTCPITLDELQVGNIALTGCYHAFSKDSLTNIELCPICRAKISKKLISYH